MESYNLSLGDKNERYGTYEVTISGKNKFDKGFMQEVQHILKIVISITLTTDYSSLYSQPYKFSDTDIPVSLRIR